MKKYLLSIFLLSLVVLSACAPTTIKPTPVETTGQEGIFLGSSSHVGDIKELEQFSSLDEYQAFANSGSSRYYGGVMFRGGIEEMVVDFAESAPVAAMADDGGSFEKVALEGSNDFSETNNQVQGVDEADIIKTDGNYIYTISGKTLFIVEAGEDAKVISRLTLDGYASGLFIYKDTLAVFGYEYDEAVYDTIGFRPQSGMTYFDVYDMSDREDLELVEEYSFEGNYFNARMIEDQVYFAVRSSPEYRPIHPLPIVYRNDIVEEVAIDKIMWHPGMYDYAQLVSIHAIDLGDGEVESLSVAVDNAQTLYMSQNNMYILGSERINEYELEQEILRELLEDKLTSEDKNLIAVIEKADNRVLTQSEKQQKIMEVYYKRAMYLSSDEQKAMEKEKDSLLAKKLKEIKYFTYTTVYKIEVDDGDIEYVSNGKVPGRTINQFSLDEYDNYLRVGTTVDARWSRFGESRTDSYSNVFVLDEDLNIVGELTKLAPTERIYSTRFVDERLYMVTFRQVDPFFVIDLSDVKNPKNLGELKIPGFSRYLHPYDKNHIIGLGQDATELGRTQGLKISIFNVEDVAHPKEVAQFVTEEKYASSSALYEHKAFLFSKEKNLLVIPAYSNGYNDGDKYNGAFVFDITMNKIELRGLIDHSSDSYYSQVERSLYINDLLYTKSPQLLRVNDLDTLEGVVDVDLKEKVGIPIF